MIRVLRAVPVVIASALLVRALVLFVPDMPRYLFLVDWATYVTAANHVLAGAPIYAADQLHGEYYIATVVGYGYAYPPPSALMFLPFMSYPLGAAGWLALNIGLFLSGVLAIARAELRPSAVAVALTIALLWMAGGLPFIEGVYVANVNVGLAGLVGWAYVLRDRPRAIAVAAATGALTKVFGAALVFLVDRRSFVRTAAMAGAIAVIAGLITLPFLGIQSWLDFATAMGGSRPWCNYNTTLSIACQLEPGLGVAGAKLATVAIAAGLSVMALLVPWRLAKLWLVVGAWAAVVADFHQHTWLVVAIPVFASIVRGLAIAERRFTLVAPRSTGGLRDDGIVPA